MFGVPALLGCRRRARASRRSWLSMTPSANIFTMPVRSVGRRRSASTPRPCDRRRLRWCRSRPTRGQVGAHRQLAGAAARPRRAPCPRGCRRRSGCWSTPTRLRFGHRLPERRRGDPRRSASAARVDEIRRRFLQVAGRLAGFGSRTITPLAGSCVSFVMPASRQRLRVHPDAVAVVAGHHCRPIGHDADRAGPPVGVPPGNGV